VPAPEPTDPTDNQRYDLRRRAADAREQLRRTDIHRQEDPVDWRYAHLEDLLDILVDPKRPNADEYRPMRRLFHAEALEVYSRLRADGMPGRAAITAAGLR
jgi:hypothetical protein